MKEPLFCYRAVVVHVYDGDSMTVDLDLGLRVWQRGAKLRLYGIDTPELRGAEIEEGCFARDRVREWCPVGSEVIVETHKDRSGKYGRWLAVIWPAGWTESVNDRLLRAGLARPYLA